MMVKKAPMRPKKSFEAIRNEWHEIERLDAKNRIKAMRTLAHEISVNYKKEETTPEEVTCYIKIMRQAIRTQSFPEKISRFLSKLIADWLSLTGNDQAEILQKKSLKISVESGGIAIADLGALNKNPLITTYSEKNYLSVMNQGDFFYFATGADGLYDVQLRVIDCIEPVLTPKEFRFVIDNTDTQIIHVPTGVLTVGDPHSLSDEKNSFSLSIPPGHYKACVYFFHVPKKLESFYVVLCKTNEAIKNNLSQIHQFGFVM